MVTTQARHLTREHLMRHIKVIDGKTYIGTLRHFTHTQTSVSVFITSSDNAVIIGSLTLQPAHEITFTGDTK